MGLLENLGLLALTMLVGVFVGTKWGRKLGVSSVAEVEHKAEVARGEAHEANDHALNQATTEIKQRAEQLNSVGASKTISDMINRGEVSR